MHPIFVNLVSHKIFSRFGSTLHGEYGEDTLEPLVNLARAILEIKEQRQQQVYWAVLLGMLSHYATDVIFHPLVYYFTGNYFDQDPAKRKEAQTRHHIFEVYLDSWIRPRARKWHSYKFANVVKALGKDLDSIVKLLGGNLRPDIEDRDWSNEWATSFRHMAISQGLFRSPLMGFLVRTYNLATAGSFSPLRTVCSHTLEPHPQSVFDNEIEYKKSGKRRNEESKY